MTVCKIGIIAGMGAAAGARFYCDLITKCQSMGARKDSDFPEIFLHNMNSTGMDETGIVDPDTVKNDLMWSVRLLEGLGAEVIAIACNSVHVYYRYLQNHATAKILNMVEIAAESVIPANKVGVICSRSSKEYGLYKNSPVFAAAKTKIIETTEAQQIVVDGVIGRAIAGIGTVQDITDIGQIAASMKKSGAANVILGCTELPLVGHIPGCVNAGDMLINSLVAL